VRVAAKPALVQVSSRLQADRALLHDVVERLVLAHHAQVGASSQHQQQDQHHAGRQQEFGADA